MNIKRSIGNIIKINEFAFILLAYIAYIVLTVLTASDINDSLYESLTYFLFIHLFLMPLYLFFIGKHDTYVNLLYCHVRFRSSKDAFFVRLVYLLAETVMFIIPFVCMIFIFAIASQVNVSVITLLLCGINVFLHFLMAGIIACAVSVRLRKDYYGAIAAYLILCVDFMFVFGFLTWDFSFYYEPMLKVFTFTEITKVLMSVLISTIKAVIVFGCAYIPFIFKNDELE